jgi:hypothetical protein
MSGEALQRLGQNGRRYYDRHFERRQLMLQLEEWMMAEAAGA